MAANTNPIFVANRQTWTAEILPGDGTTPVDLVVAGANGSLIEAIGATSTDTGVVELVLYLVAGSLSVRIGSATVAITAGTDGGTTPATNILTQADLPWLRDDLTLALGAGWTLQVGAHAAVTAAKAVRVFALGGDY
jgi:hypothetical protein